MVPAGIAKIAVFWLASSACGESSVFSPLGSSEGNSSDLVDEVANSGSEALKTEEVVLAMPGGGFRAFSGNVGLLVGLLAAKAKKDGNASAAPTLESTNPFQKFKKISTSSGSSWFMAQLIYAPDFLALIESMAASPGSAGELFQKKWMDGFLALRLRARPSARIFTQTARGLGLHGFAQTLELVDYFWQGGMTWDEFIGTLLQSTAGLTSEVRLGSPVAAWSKDKIWLICHSLMVGAADTPAYLTSGLGTSVRYWMQPGLEAPASVYIPARFSMKLGAGKDAAAPLPYLADGLAANAKVKYEGKAFFGIWRREATAPLGDFGPLTASMGQLPVVDAVGASSAALGGVCFSQALTTSAWLLRSDFVPWAAVAESGGTAFSKGSSLAQNLGFRALAGGALQKVASATVLGTGDSGYTDTGIAQAVAAGATEVTVLLSVGKDPKVWNWLNVFQGTRSKSKAASESIGIPVSQLPIFRETVDDAKKQYNDFVKLSLPENPQYLLALRTGTIKATTVESKLFGISPGLDITIHMVAVTTSLNVGGLDDFRHYSILVQEIVDCLTAERNEASLEEHFFTKFF